MVPKSRILAPPLGDLQFEDCVIFLGGNDLPWGKWHIPQHLLNLRLIVTAQTLLELYLLLKQMVPKVSVVTLVPRPELSEQVQAGIDKVNRMLMDWLPERDIIKLHQRIGRQHILRDRVHLNTAGMQRMTEAVRFANKFLATWSRPSHPRLFLEPPFFSPRDNSGFLPQTHNILIHLFNYFSKIVQNTLSNDLYWGRRRFDINSIWRYWFNIKLRSTQRYLFLYRFDDIFLQISMKAPQESFPLHYYKYVIETYLHSETWGHNSGALSFIHDPIQSIVQTS